MKGYKEFINEEYFKGGKSDNISLDDIAKKHNIDIKELEKELKKGIEVELEHTNDKDKAKEIAKDHLIEMPDYYTRLLDMEKEAESENKDGFGDTIEIIIDLHIPDDEDLEDYDEEIVEKLRKLKVKEINSAKVVRETSKELFGEDGTHRSIVDKLFKIFKREIRMKSKELGVPLGTVRTWKLTLRDTDNPRVNTSISGKPQ